MWTGTTTRSALRSTSKGRRRGGGDLAVEVDLEGLVGEERQPAGGEVVHPIVLDEVAGPQQSGDRHVVARPSLPELQLR